MINRKPSGRTTSFYKETEKLIERSTPVPYLGRIKAVRLSELKPNLTVWEKLREKKEPKANLLYPPIDALNPPLKNL
jgi:hypothetical protein